MTQAEFKQIKERLAELSKAKSANTRAEADIILLAKALNILMRDITCS